MPVLILVGGYVLWKALRGDGPWRLLALALVLQIPVCLIVVVEEWAARQFLVTQTLLFCALAALVVDASEAALWGRALSGRIIAALVAVLNHSLVLLKSTGRTPRAVPTQMTSNTELRLRRCEQAKGPA